MTGLGGMGRESFDQFEKLQAEIQREKAEALGRAGERLEEVLRKLTELRSAIDALQGELKRATFDHDSLRQAVRMLVREYNVLRQKATVYRRYLIIQRQAIGLSDHGDVDRLYRLPDPLHEVTGEG